MKRAFGLAVLNFFSIAAVWIGAQFIFSLIDGTDFFAVCFEPFCLAFCGIIAALSALSVFLRERHMFDHAVHSAR